MSTLVTRTSLTNMRPLGGDGERSHARVTSILEQELSPAHARMLAEPVPVRDGSGVDWYVDDDEGQLVSVNSLSETDASEVREKLAARTRDIEEAAERIENAQGAGSVASTRANVLRSSISYPSESSIWALRDAEGHLEPVIVAWGYAPHNNSTGTGFNVSTFSTSRAPRRAATAPIAGAATAAGATAAGGDDAVGAGNGGANNVDERTIVRRSGPGWLGWLWGFLALLALLVLLWLIAAFLLPACGLRTPFGTIAFGLPGQVACQENEEVTVIAEDLFALDRELRVLQDEYARRRLQCVPEVAPEPEELEPFVEPEPLVEPEPEPEPAPEPDEEFTERIDDRGETQITLIWSGPDDVDLHVICPSGAEIYYSRDAACGGVLDVDANAGSQTMPNPVENITFGDDMQDGTYRIKVVLFDNPSRQNPLPFRVRIRNGGGERIYDGELHGDGDVVEVGEFTK